MQVFRSLVVELAFEGEQLSCCFILHLTFTHLAFLVRVLIPCAPVVGVLSFFLLELQQCSSERGMLEMLPLQGSFCGTDYLFSPLS
jgi:hypothetical protein